MSVVILHGFTGDGSTMRALADLVDPAALVPDLAGHGAGPHSLRVSARCGERDPAPHRVADEVAPLAGERQHLSLIHI